MTTTLIYETIAITVGVISIYTTITRPLRRSIDNLTLSLQEISKTTQKVKEDIIKASESAKYAHFRINDMEGYTNEFRMA